MESELPRLSGRLAMAGGVASRRRLLAGNVVEDKEGVMWQGGAWMREPERFLC